MGQQVKKTKWITTGLLLAATFSSGCERATYTSECKMDEDCNDSNFCTWDICTRGVCHYSPVNEDHTCNDLDPCTTGDVCTSGKCVGQPKNCGAFDGPCFNGICNPETGMCVSEPEEDGTICDDGFHCTVADTCQEGECIGVARDCNDDDPCTVDACSEGDNSCFNIMRPKPGFEGLSIENTCANALDDDCDGLVDSDDPNCNPCVQDADCEDNNACTSDLCLAEECINEPVADGTNCDDGLYCTENDVCQTGVCMGVAHDCSEVSDACHVGVCVERDDVCMSQTMPDGVICEDGLFCTVGDRCASGVCEGVQQTCDDDEACTVDSCDEERDRCINELVPRPGEEGPFEDPTCSNGVDDDCDGLTDAEDSSCSSDSPTCNDADHDGYNAFHPQTCPEGNDCCDSGTESHRGCTQATASSINPAAVEICNGYDENCNGQSDETFPDLGQPCAGAPGVCARPGIMICTADRTGTTCSATPGQGTAEICDGLDNDCDGQTDEDFGELGDSCTTGVGACRSEGILVCGPFGVYCDSPAIDPQAELCDGIDNDCDGSTDENFPRLGMPCMQGTGECLAQGQYVCTPDKSTTECNAVPPQGGTELCDGLDNDCDGFTDNGWFEPCSTVCGDGFRFCTEGSPGACSARLPSADDSYCDYIDNDCDGQTDEDVPGLGDPCQQGTGGCLFYGWIVCDETGGTKCNAVAGTPRLEDFWIGQDTCIDGVDNDCDGLTDSEDPECL